MDAEERSPLIPSSSLVSQFRKQPTRIVDGADTERIPRPFRQGGTLGDISSLFDRDVDVMSLAADERRDLAEFLATLSEDDWDQQSLCEGWRVIDVVAHLVSYEPLGARELVSRLAKSTLRFSKANAAGLVEARGATPADLLEILGLHLRPRGLTRAFGGRIGLTDSLIHHQDIRRALGRPRKVPTERLRVALDFSFWAVVLPSGRNARGLHLAAEDLDWTRGSGPAVAGPAEALLMATAGRAAALSDLSGDGIEILRRRIG